MDNEQKQNVAVEEATDFDSKVDSFYSEKDKVVPEDDSSASKDDQTEETEESKAEGDDPLKTSKEPDEESESKDSNKDPRDLMFRKGYNEAKAKLEPIVKEYEGIKGQLDEFKKVTSSPEYIQFQMKNQGYTQEAIDAKLTELGHKVQPKQEAGLDLVLNRLGVDISQLDDDGKKYVNTQVADMVKVFDILFHDRYGKVSSSQLQPIQDQVQSIVGAKESHELLDNMEEIVKSEGVLDFEKDVLPAIDKWLDDNPKATREETRRQFEIINHKLSLERMRLGTRKEAREVSKKGLRSQKEGSKIAPSGLKKTGNFDKDADAFLDAIGNHN